MTASAASAPARVPINRTLFFDRIRACGVFGPTLSQTEVDGLNGLLDAWGEQGWPADLRWVAYTIATAWHEARLNGAIREYGRGAGHDYGRPAGPYGQVYYGRSFSQLTWLDNYQKFSKLIGVDLVKEPDLALDPTTGAAILIIGSRDGLFRAGKSLGRFFSATVDDPIGARDIINGDITKNGALVAGYHAKVLGCLKAAYQPALADIAPPIAKPAPSAAVIIDKIDPQPLPTPKPATPAPLGFWARLGALIRRTDAS
ncbi:hypothetical protein [Methylobacterium gnaphalii]|uniref:Glycoside hydrolase family 19 catalytic domain-containing protein n=1 Tax=Methylobacterium gnaphalii TaxID=1010610 RepID=A0A512JMB6_9HYPH|nr:hypothetical protein [Methylobacterium gnaphalii]GEP11107.1 hypothetical protein MGN01_29520 [Methylobacterium gnaphalii]GJD69897.1 hypothetical protein MMMDOFMJ_2836 [Methylobacterium gnaphalii]GLS50385.1 hypothetical protein GCM10007885_32370 [Methylobacterium gnaphalii]